MFNKQPSKAILFVVVLILISISFWNVVVNTPEDSPKVMFSEFEAGVTQKNIDKVTIVGMEIEGTCKEKGKAPCKATRDRFTTVGVVDPDLRNLMQANEVKYEFKSEEQGSFWQTLLITWLPVLLLLLVFFLFMRQIQSGGGKAMSFGKSRARLLNENQTKVTFADVAGIDGAKEELQEIVEFLKDPKKFTRLGGRVPKGILLMGPPGTGKTLLARAVAGEAGVPFFSISGSDFVEMFVGVGASRVRDLFEQAKKNAPCIIFVDEIDAVGRHRGAGIGGGHDEREQTLNQLLVEMDGFEANEGVILIAATNRPDILDPALTRPGRFDRKISVPLPDLRGREKILRIHARRTPLAANTEEEFTKIAQSTQGFSGADLESLVNEAAFIAARQNKESVDTEDLYTARSKVFRAKKQQLQIDSSESMNMGKSQARLLDNIENTIDFDKVGGVEEVKQELQEIVGFVKEPSRYTRLGGRIPKGVLLVGPPGTGKTLLARAVAGEAGVPLFSCSGSDFIDRFVGGGTSRVRDLFEQARNHNPCIILIDEIDIIAQQRGEILNQLLVEMENFDPLKGGIVVATTNRPEVLDPALTRAGRFDRKISIPLPNEDTREAILKQQIAAKTIPFDPSIDQEVLAQKTQGFSGADLENLINEAALIAARDEKKTAITAEDLQEAREKIFNAKKDQNRSGGNENTRFGQMQANLFHDAEIKVRFEDVAGIEKLKEELQEVVAFLRNPDKFTKLGGRVPKGVLLAGPPGTGKTLLARAVAGEAGVPFFSLSGSDFMEMFAGVGASRVRDLFEQARTFSPCIVFIDEIDAIGQRGEKTLNQLLVELDGFEANKGVILIAATNFPESLDPALTRPGRFDRKVVIPLPNAQAREAILRYHIAKRGAPLASDALVSELVFNTQGFSGADLENLINEAAFIAARQDKVALDHESLHAAKLKIFQAKKDQTRINAGQDGRFGQNKARMFHGSESPVRFDDVAGIEEVKEELEEVVDFLRDPKKFSKLGGRVPKGVLLSGPPGTGKTLLARAVAGEAGVPFLASAGSDFVQMFVGVGASRVRDLFEQARQFAPCIVFIDEIDALGSSRSAGIGGGQSEHSQTLNQLLVELDGFETNQGIILIGATNRPDMLDPALTRPGRIDRKVSVPLPDVRGREKILGLHARKTPLAPDVDLKLIARGTPGFSGADLANLVNEAALWAARKGREAVEAQDFSSARDKVLMGPERRSAVIPERERRLTAYHEAGHAIVALDPDMKTRDALHKVTIIPRGWALGVTQQIPDEDRLAMTREYAINQIRILMGGRAAEELVNGKAEITTGAGNDIQRATELARRMICEWGMSEKFGPVAYTYRQEQLPTEIHQEIREMITGQYSAALKLLTDNLDKLHALAKALLAYETLDGEEIHAALRGEDVEEFRKRRKEGDGWSTPTPFSLPSTQPTA